MLNANYTINNVVGISAAMVEQVRLLTDYALHAWGSLLAGNATINIKLTFVESTSSGRAQGGNETGSFLGTYQGRNVFEPGAAYELRTGLETGGSGADIHIQFSRDYLLNTMFIDPTPATANDVPTNKTDGLSVLLHEIGHGLGFIGYWQEATNTWQDNANTVYDTRMTLVGGEAFFDGPNVRAYYGAAVPLTDNNYTHYGNTTAYPGTSTDPLTGLMNGKVFYDGWRYGITDFELAMLADLGYGTIRDDILDNPLMHVFTGGQGNDTYYVHAQSDVIREYAGEGTDLAIADAGYYLWGEVDNLTLAGSGDIFGVGNELNNILTGNAGSNLLIAHAGNDTIRAGGGVDSAFGMDGDDTINGEAGIDYLVGGTGNDTLDGGSDADALYGEDGSDILWGGADFQTDIFVGGTGNDTLRGDSGLADYDRMDGGADDDSYYVDTGDDLTFEAAGGGTDTVYANVGGANNGVYLYANVENLVLLNTTTFGVGNELANTLTGSASGNWLLGGAGNDVINGKAGNDVLFGEGGADTFIFDAGSGGDVIGDFAPGTDKIDISVYFSSWQAVINSMHENGGTTAIDLGGGNLIVLNGVANAALSASDFVLGGAGPAEPQAFAAPATTGVPADMVLDEPRYALVTGNSLPIELFL